jgi:hypothetical protein
MKLISQVYREFKISKHKDRLVSEDSKNHLMIMVLI